MALLPGQVLVSTTTSGRINLLCTKCRMFCNRTPLRPGTSAGGTTLADLLFEVNEHRCAS